MLVSQKKCLGFTFWPYCQYKQNTLFLLHFNSLQLVKQYRFSLKQPPQMCCLSETSAQTTIVYQKGSCKTFTCCYHHNLGIHQTNLDINLRATQAFI